MHKRCNLYIVTFKIPQQQFSIRLTDEQAKVIIELYSGCKNATEFQALQKTEQEKNIGTFKEKGLSIRQIVRLAGISKGLVEKWLR